MGLIIPNIGEEALLDRLLKDSSETFTLNLYKNNYNPDQYSLVGDFVNADFTGYSTVVLDPLLWSSAVVALDRAESTYPTLTWTCGATGGFIYGYYIVGTTSGRLYWAEKFTTPFVVSNTDIFNLIPVFTLFSEI